MSRSFARCTLFAAALTFFAPAAEAQFSQEGSKLVGSNGIGNSTQGGYVALSNDGNTLIAGGFSDNGQVGAAWVFTRSNGTWSQQGQKLVGAGAVGAAAQGSAVALSVDGNTAAIGAAFDNGNAGAAWIFVRTNGVWAQQGNKLVGTGAVGSAFQQRVALSADGNTLLLGGANDDGGKGAVWVFTRSNGVWTQQGSKLVGTGMVGAGQQGIAAALSADGNTALIGGGSDNGGLGAAWVFTRSNGVWTQQGNKLVGSGAIQPGLVNQGDSVALSADGNTAMIAGDRDNNRGAVWFFTRSNGVWTQQGNKLAGDDAVGTSGQLGIRIGLSADGDTAVAGRPGDNGTIGATFVFKRTNGVWAQQGAKLIGSGAAGNAAQGFATISGDGNTIAAGATLDNANKGATWVFTQPTSPTTLVSAVLPASRSVQVGTAATAFATIINTGSATAFNCALSIDSGNPATFSYQTTNAATNQPTLAPNFPFRILAGASQSYVFAITPSAAFATTDIPIAARCTNSTDAPTVVGLSTLLMSASASPVPDLVALAATVTNDGIVNIPGTNGTGAFSVASVNVGIGSAITVSADTGSASLPVTLSLCQTDASAQCVNPAVPAATASLTIAANATPTFSIFITGNGTIPFDPAAKRIFVRFKDGGGAVRGATSVAVRTQ